VDCAGTYSEIDLGLLSASSRTVMLPHSCELIEKLAALIPPPRLNLVRYHGVFAPNAADRAQIVPRPEADAEGSGEGSDPVPAGSPPRRPCRLSWAQLLSRVFHLEVTVCPACGGSMKIIAALTDAPSIRGYLEGVGLPARPPPIAPARPDPQQAFDYAA